MHRSPNIRGAPHDEEYDTILVALHPNRNRCLDHNDAEMIATKWAGAVVAQFWDDLNREAFAAREIPLRPLPGPAPGHKGILPSTVGPEPVERFQAGRYERG